MSRNNIIVIVIAVILIIICIIEGINKNDEKGIVGEVEERREVISNTVTNEVTGKEEYVVYNKETGEEITRVQEEHQLKIYEIDPTYEELSVESTEEPIQEESIIE